MYNEKVMIIGEFSSLISFLSTFLTENYKEELARVCPRHSSENGKEDNFFQVYYSDIFKVNSCGNKVEIYTPFIPCGIMMECVSFEAQWQEKECSVVLFLFSFKFQKYLSVLKKISKKVSFTDTPLRFKAIAFDDTSINTGATDLSDDRSEFEAMVESVEAELAKHRLLNTVEIVGYRDRNDIYGLFSGGDYTLLFSDDCLDKEFENICINISDFKDYCYPGVMGDVDELWNQDVQKEITDYSVVKNSSDLIKSFINGFFKTEAWNVLVRGLQSEYQNYFGKIAFWDLEKDMNDVFSIIYKKSYDFLYDGSPKIGVKGKSEIDYIKMQSKEKYDFYFRNKVESLLREQMPFFFVEELKKKARMFI
ncbi:MAG: hypothetical protein J6A58_08175 [Oscillospiraceae bacterium]|nr:hypothetical protein [Oscillospiraceae bacterium]